MKNNIIPLPIDFEIKRMIHLVSPLEKERNLKLNQKSQKLLLMLKGLRRKSTTINFITKPLSA